MRKLFFALAFMLVGSFAFANNSVEKTIEIKTEKTENISNKDTLETKIEIIINDREKICFRYCVYRGGVLQGCTPWECERIATEELDEIVINA